jgi:hypothetical protein
VNTGAGLSISIIEKAQTVNARLRKETAKRKWKRKKCEETDLRAALAHFEDGAGQPLAFLIFFLELLFQLLQYLVRVEGFWGSSQQLIGEKGETSVCACVCVRVRLHLLVRVRERDCARDRVREKEREREGESERENESGRAREREAKVPQACPQ